MLMLTLLVSALVVFCASKKSPNYRLGLTLDKKNPSDPGPCSKVSHGQMKLVKDRRDEDKVIICSNEKPNSYLWKTLDGTSTLGEYFDPVLDCTDVVDRLPDATDGFYWIYPKEVKKVVKVWCDATTDGGGYMLVAKKNDSVTWTVPSSKETVDPFGKPHWSSIFGYVKILDIRFQFSTTSLFKDTKAHWSFRLTNERRFGELLIRDRGGCTEHNPGIGDIKFVKDLQIGKIVNRNFRCSLFGGHTSPLIGWGMMNKCLLKSCPGFAFFPGLPGVRFDDSGSFSYSAKDNSTSSGIWHSSTAFIGCSHGKCCACYGPRGGTDNYCLKNCTAINGGKITKQVETWIWIRSSPPKRIWRKCIDYTVKGPNRKEEKYRVDEETGLKEKGSCGTSEEIKNNGGVLVVPNKVTLKKIPPAQGLLAFRPINQQLFVQGQKGWNKIAMEKKVHGEQQIILQKLTSKQNAFANQLNGKQRTLEQNQQNMEKQITIKQRAMQRQQQTADQQLKSKLQSLEQQIRALRSQYKSVFKNLKSCKKLKVQIPSSRNGVYSIDKISTYCDMVNNGWTLVARFSNKDSKNWISSGSFWYNRNTDFGKTTDPTNNGDMISKTFWKIKGQQFKISRSDDSRHTALLQTASNCLQGGTFRSKITSYGNFRNGTVWASNLCRGSCPVIYGGQYKSTAGFEQHSCNSKIQRSNYIGFWCDWDSGDGAVMMIGGGGSNCNRADHGIGITEQNAAKFGSGADHHDFGNIDNFKPNAPTTYSLNLWVR